jgi:hypothetical protein
VRRSDLSVNAAGLRWRAEVPADRHLIAFAMESPGSKRKRKGLQGRPQLSGSAPPGQVPPRPQNHGEQQCYGQRQVTMEGQEVQLDALQVLQDGDEDS